MRARKIFLLLLMAIFVLSSLLAYNWLPIPSYVPVASANAYVIGSDPVDGSTVSAAPKLVRIFFNEVIGSASIAHIYAPDGSLVDGARSRIAANNPRELDTPLKSNGLPQGGYTVRWTAVSSDDGHTTHGVIGFNIGQSSVGLPGETILGPSTSNILPQLDLLGVLSVAWDWLVQMALTFWIGILVMEGLLLARGTSEPGGQGMGTSEQQEGRVATLLAQARKQSLPLQWLALAALLVGEVITLILRATLLTQGLGGSGIDVVALRQLTLETSYGHLWLLRIACICGALGLLWWVTRSSRGEVSVGRKSSSRFGELRRQVVQEQEQEQGQAQDHGRQEQEQQGREQHTSPAVEKEGKARTEGTETSKTWSHGYTAAWLVLAGLILLSLAPSNDVVELVEQHTSAIVLNWLYLAAQSVWFGGLAYLGYTLLPLLRVTEPNQHSETLTLLCKRLVIPALVVLGVLLVCLLFLSEASLSGAGLLLSDPYGRALLVKIVLIGLMLLLTVYVLFVAGAKLARQAALLPVVDAEMPARRTRLSALEKTECRLGQSLKLATWLGAGALLCAALMAFYAPPIVFPPGSYATSTSTGTNSTTAAINAQTQASGDLKVTMEVLPGRVDYVNTVIVTINDAQGNPVTDAQVQLSTNMELMDMGTARASVKGGNPTYIATFNAEEAFSMPGLWDITVRIQRPRQAPVEMVFKVTLAQ